MEKEFKPKAESIREKYSKGPGTAPEVSDVQVPGQTPMTREQVEEFLDKELPLMRKQAEYDKLLMEQLENDVLLNRRPIENIPGLLGLELKVRQLQAIGYLGQYKAHLEQVEANKDNTSDIKKAEGVIVTFLKDMVIEGDNKILSGTDIVVSDPEGRVAMTTSTGTKEYNIYDLEKQGIVKLS